MGDATKLILTIQGWVDDPLTLTPLLEGLAQIPNLFPDREVSFDTLVHCVTTEASGQVYSDPISSHGVLLLPLMRARGVRAKAAVLMGLSAQRFPSRISEDPLLSDYSRQQLVNTARDVGHRLSVKSRAIDEMTLLFYLLNSSAELIHWVIPETDEQGKSVAPTAWILRYVQHWENAGQDHQKDLKPIPRNPLEQARYLYELDSLKGSMLPPEYAMLLEHSQPEEGSLDLDKTPNRSPADQQPGSSSVLDIPTPVRVSVTQLEDLARCPFRFWARSVAKLQTLSPRPHLSQLDPLHWGRVVHSLLEQIYEYARRNKLSTYDTAEQLLSNPTSHLSSLYDSLPASLSMGINLLPSPLKHAHVSRLFVIITSYLQLVSKEEPKGTYTVATEMKIRHPNPELKVLLSGKMDRVDFTGDHTVVIDYKSGRSPWRDLKSEMMGMELGFYLQPTLYPWLYQKQNAKSVDTRFSYVFLGENPPRTLETRAFEYAHELLNNLGSLLSSKYYGPTSNEGYAYIGLEEVEPCVNCDLGSLCRRFEANKAHRDMAAFEDSAPGRLRYVRKHTTRTRKKE
jgi:hypothetical protein